jgi:pyrroline-5-carboxylate reductase
MLLNEAVSVLAGCRLAFVGSGVMAESMMTGLLEKKLVDPQNIVASHPRSKRLEDLETRLGVRSTTSNRETARSADIVLLCVKPQRLRPVLTELSGIISSNQLVISIVAGANLSTIAQQLRHAAVVRVIPNTPAQIGHGISVWTCTQEVNEEQRTQARAILAALGKEMYFEEERFVDMATAISSSGPAYVFLVMEALIDAAVHLGFSRHDARALVTQTLLGSVLFAQESHKHPAELRNMVTSPNGTSAEALYQLEKGGLRTILSKAVYAAYQKTAVLNEIINKSKD